MVWGLPRWGVKGPLGLFLAVAAFMPASAVDLVNADEETYMVFVCGDGCDGVSEPGRWLDVLPNQSWSDVCQNQCTIQISTDGSYKTRDLSGVALFHSDDVAVIESGLIVKKKPQPQAEVPASPPVTAPAVNSGQSGQSGPNADLSDR